MTTKPEPELTQGDYIAISKAYKQAAIYQATTVQGFILALDNRARFRSAIYIRLRDINKRAIKKLKRDGIVGLSKAGVKKIRKKFLI